MKVLHRIWDQFIKFHKNSALLGHFLLKMSKHLYKVSKATPGVKIIYIFPCLAQNNEFVGRWGE